MLSRTHHAASLLVAVFGDASVRRLYKEYIHADTPHGINSALTTQHSALTFSYFTTLYLSPVALMYSFRKDSG